MSVPTESVLSRRAGQDANAIGAQQPAGTRQQEGYGLLLIALEKLVRGSFLIVIGLGALDLIHRNLGDVLLNFALHLHVDPLSPLMTHLMDRADLVSGRELRRAGALSLFFAATAITEGIGLLMRKVWAEYLTLGVTTAAMPVELYEIFRHPHWTRFALFGVNVAVFVYLLWHLRQKGLLGPASPSIR